jgi:hypothetical protein
MIEIKGDLWDYYGKPNYATFITTNGFVKRNGEGVMGRGCALEAKQRIPWIAKTLGDSIRSNGNVPQLLQHYPPLFSFPVKHNWWERADLALIELSISHLRNILLTIGWENTKFILPRPGCGNGQLLWTDVKPLFVSVSDRVLVITK